jgi:hypothetical protein
VTVVVAAGAIAVVLTSGSPGGGVAHTVVMPAALGGRPPGTPIL